MKKIEQLKSRKVASIEGWEGPVYLIRNQDGRWYCRTSESWPAAWTNIAGARAALGQLNKSADTWRLELR